MRETKLDKVGDKVFKFMAQTAGSVVPTGLRQIDEAFDPTIYETKDIDDFFINKVPFVRGTQLRPRLDPWGREVEKAGGRTLEGGAYRLTGDRFIYKPGTQEKYEKLAAMKDITVPTPSPLKKINGHELTPDQHYEYSKMVGEVLRKKVTDDFDRLKELPKEKLITPGDVKQEDLGEINKLYKASEVDVLDPFMTKFPELREIIEEEPESSSPFKQKTPPAVKNMQTQMDEVMKKFKLPFQ